MTAFVKRRISLASSGWLFVASCGISCRLATTTITKKVTLITFDVDGTLIHGSSSSAEISSHARAFSHGVGSTFSSNVEDFLLKYPYPLSAIDPKYYHGSTDGLIALHFAKEACGIEQQESYPKLNEVFQNMFEYVISLPDDVMCKGIEPLPGVITTLTSIANHPLHKEKQMMCGLVTGNVEGIARKKMRACGILDTKVLSVASAEQISRSWLGEENSSFLGGFGSDFCSGDIEDTTRIYKDRGEQIVIAYNRAKTLLGPDEEITRVVHCGDAPGDVLAAKYCSDSNKFGDAVTVSCIAVATGKFSALHLEGLFGEKKPGKWEPVVLEKGLADPSFFYHCIGNLLE